MQGCKSAKYFDSCGDGNNYCGRGKVGSGVYVHADCKHVMGSYNKTKKTDGHYGSDHAHVAEWFLFARVVGYDV